MPEIKLEWHEEFLVKRPRVAGNQLQAIKVIAEYDPHTQEIEHDSVEIWVWEENKAKLNITHIAVKMDFFNSIVDNIKWRELYRNSKYADENDIYEQQYQD